MFYVRSIIAAPILITSLMFLLIGMTILFLSHLIVPESKVKTILDHVDFTF